jgi:hypothetical protein
MALTWSRNFLTLFYAQIRRIIKKTQSAYAVEIAGLAIDKALLFRHFKNYEP